MTKVKQVGNFVIGNTQYLVHKVNQNGYKYCTYSCQDSSSFGRTNFADEDVFNLTDEEITVEALKFVVDVQQQIKEILG